MQDLDIGVLIPNQPTVQLHGQEFFNLLCNTLPAFMPSRYGNWEPLEQDFTFDQLDEVLSCWNETFIWRGKRLACEGSVSMDSERIHSTIHISGKSKLVDCDQVINFLLKLADLLKPDFAYVHLFSDKELDAIKKGVDTTLYDMSMPFRRGVVTPDLSRYLPDLCWGTIFGSPYIQLFGRENLLSSPAPIIKELSGNAIYIQLSDSLKDLKSGYQAVNITRQKVKNHLNNNAFLDFNLGKGHQYNTPEFKFVHS